MAERARRPRVLLADDSPPMCTAVSALLAASCDVLATVGNIPALFDAVFTLKPDVVLLDFSLPGNLDALDVCRCLKRMMPEMHVVALTGHDEPELRKATYAAGASAFVSKMQAATDLQATIESVVQGY